MLGRSYSFGYFNVFVGGDRMKFFKKDWTGVWLLGIGFKEHYVILFIGRHTFVLGWRK